MVQNLPETRAYSLIISDFKRAWKSLATGEKGRKRQGAMFFGFLVMNLLEFVCRLCKSDERALIEFSNILNEIEGKYFIHLPNLPMIISTPKKFSLPHLEGQESNDLLLTLLFDLIRNGLGHLYQPTIVKFKDGRQFSIVLPVQSKDIEVKKRSNHLSCKLEKNGDIQMTVYPQYLLCHIDEAVKKSKLLDNECRIKPFDKDYSNIDILQLEKYLRDGGVEFVEALR